MDILVDATTYRAALTVTIADIIANLRAKTPIAAWIIFDTVALRPVNPTATSQLGARLPLVTTDGKHWISPGALLPLTLDYRLWQEDRPILIKVTAPGDLEMTYALDESSKILDIELVSLFKVRVLNSFQQGGQEVRVPEVLDLRAIRITTTSITYHMTGSSEERNLTIEAIYDAMHAAVVLKDAPFRIKWGHVPLLERVKLAFHVGFNEDNPPCAPDDAGEGKKWILWHKVQGNMNICDVGSAPTCVSTHPRDNSFKSLGCFNTIEEARNAESTHQLCQDGYLADPFTLATRIKVAKDVT